jgi:DNA-binding beta-propeller fold protein YncE/predicted Ser/Thr protein kinase
LSPAERPDTLAGSEVGGYRIDFLLGRGGMGSVYRAEDADLGRTVALKVLAPELAGNTRFRERFLRESRLAASLDHPHIVPIFQAGDADGVLFLAMRYVEGTDLARLIADEGPLDTERVLALLEQAASALDAAHERGLVHRDVKPSNMLIARSAGREHCYLADFGLTKRTGSISGLTATHQVVGTLDYVAPEQIRGGETDPRADVYSLACVLYECLASSPPFERATDVAVLWAHVNEEPPPVSSLRPDLPKELDGVLVRGLAKEPRDRYDKCGELVAAVRATLAPEGVAVAPRLGRRGVVALVALIVGAALAVAGFLAFGGDAGGITIEPNSVAVIDPAANKVVKGIHVGVGPDAVAARQNSVWVANTEDETISRIDPRTRELVGGAIALEGHPTDVVAGDGGSAWVALGSTASVSRVSADDVAGRPIQALGDGVACGSPAGRVAVGGGFVWYACEFADLGRVDPKTGSSGVAIGYEAGLLESASPVPPEFTDVAFGFDRVWLVNSSANSVVEIDTSRVVREITVGRRPVAIATGEGALWVACFGDDAVWRIDIPGPGRPVTPTRIPVGDGPSAVAVGEGGVWVVNRNKGTVSRVDPERNEVAETITIGNGLRDVAAGGGAVWVTVGASGDS